MNRKRRTVSFIIGGLAGMAGVTLITIGLIFLGTRGENSQSSNQAEATSALLLPPPTSQGNRQEASEGTNPVLPTPIGFPDTAQDVGTMVLKPAPAFTLQDDTGQRVTVTPGQTGRPTVLIFNMGLG